MHKFSLTIAALLLGLTTAFGAAAQTTVPFGGLKQDTSLPVEISSDSFSISQKDGTAVFDGNVVVAQGPMRLSAGKVVVEYAAKGDESTGRIGRLIASGGVVLVSGSEAAEADQAIYSLGDGTIVLQGDVILTQGDNAMSGGKITINLSDGSALIEGRVKTIFQTGSDN